MMTTASNDNNNNDDGIVSFVVTGFGPFRNARENPTTIIANELVEYLKSNDNNSCLAFRTTTRVIETSAQAARNEVDDMMQSNTTNTTVYLHLGVNYKGKEFKLEQCAYNDATFRIPDECGYQPRNQFIAEDCNLGFPLSTTLNVETMCQELELKCTSPIVTSTDPGRFVCNYTYFCSLNKTKDEPNVYSLFVHVPPFSVIPKEEQMKVVVQIMQCLDEQLSGSTRANTTVSKSAG